MELSLPFARGETWHGSGTVESTSAEKILGHKYEVLDTENGTGRFVTLQIVRNESGGTLAAGDCVLYKANETGLSIGGLGSPVDGRFAGYVDSLYASTIAANDVFYIVLSGPVDRHNVAAEDLLPDFSQGLKNKFQMYGPEDDFHSWLDGCPWTLTADANGTYAITDAAGGILSLLNDVTDEDESILHTEGEVFLFAANKPIVFGARVSLTEANVNDANISVGLVSGAVTSAMGDAGAGPPASYSGALFFKLFDTLAWSTETSLAGTQDTTASAATFASGTWYDLHCTIQTTSSTSATAKFYIDGVLVDTSVFTYTSATEMRFIVGVHNGSGNAETLLVDYAYCKQLR